VIASASASVGESGGLRGRMHSYESALGVVVEIEAMTTARIGLDWIGLVTELFDEEQLFYLKNSEEERN
jgi:hypothetical protein